MALAACGGGESGDDFPVQPGGPSGPSGPGVGVDAAVDADPDALMTLVGRVCVLADTRKPTVCRPTGAGNITVALGNKTATTTDTGAFTIGKPSGTGLVWRATGAGITTSLAPFGTANLIPVLTTQSYADLQNTHSVPIVAGQASIMVNVLANAMPQPDVTATISPVIDNAIRYDGPASLTWNEVKTGENGMVWIAGVDATAMNTVRVRRGTDVVPQVVPVEDQAITYVTIELD